MGLFGSDSKTYSTTNLQQSDSSVNAAEQVGMLQGSGAQYTDVGNGLLVSGTNTGEVIFNQFPESVASSLKDLIGSVDKSVSTAAQTQLQSTQALGNKLQELSLGESSIIPKLAMYGLVAFGIAIIFTRFKK